MPVKIEIELPPGLSQDNIFELRNCFRDNVKATDIHLKEQAIKEGQMGPDFFYEPILVAIVTCTAEIVFHEFVRNVWNPIIKPLVEQWWNNLPEKEKVLGDASLRKMNVSIVPPDNTKNIITLDPLNGEQQIFENVYYSIDTDHTYAVIIGCSQYANNNFPDIPPVEGNVQDVRQLLTDKLCMGLPEENISTAFNKTSEEIQKLLYNVSRIKDIETLIIYYAGHGHQVDANKYFLTAINTERIEDELIGGIDFDFIRNKILKQSPARQKILFLDACHSGVAAQSAEYTPDTKVEVEGSYVLTSSSASEVSYYTKEKRNTYFTGVLVDLFKNGIDNGNEMLTLDDLYEQSRQLLKEKNLPEPNYKSELNIPPANFFVSLNSSFSFEKIITTAEQLFKKGNAEEALQRCNSLLKHHPDNIKLLQLVKEIQTEITCAILAQEGDELLYGQKNYGAATQKYKQALKEKEDNQLRNKLKECEEQLRISTISGRKKFPLYFTKIIGFAIIMLICATLLIKIFGQGQPVDENEDFAIKIRSMLYKVSFNSSFNDIAAFENINKDSVKYENLMIANECPDQQIMYYWTYLNKSKLQVEIYSFLTQKGLSNYLYVPDKSYIVYYLKDNQLIRICLRILTDPKIIDEKEFDKKLTLTLIQGTKLPGENYNKIKFNDYYYITGSSFKDTHYYEILMCNSEGFNGCIHDWWH